MKNDLTDRSRPASNAFSVPVSACPGLFYNTPALDGTLLRIRIPRGELNSAQIRALADLAEQFGDSQVYVTNRGNLQIRSPLSSLPPDVLQRFQGLGLAAPNPTLDPLRNIMVSPTAGIDPTELIDVRLLAQTWEATLQSRPELAALPPKFSVCFDGAGTVSVADRPNDITLIAHATSVGILFRLRLGQADGKWRDTDLVVKPDQCIPLINEIATCYLEYLESGRWQEAAQLGRRVKIRRPRLRHVIADRGLDIFLQQICDRASLSRQPISLSPQQPAEAMAHLGIHPQRQPGLHYIGLVLPLGYLSVAQLRGLAELLDRGKRGSLRLTPWQNAVLYDVPTEQLDSLQQSLQDLGIHYSARSYYGTLIACAGNRGCLAAATDTQTHARAVVQQLEQANLNHLPIEIHFSGCEKSCAQPHPRGISLVGTRLPDASQAEGYDIYIQDSSIPAESFQQEQGRFGQLLSKAVPAHQVSQVLATVLQQHSFTSRTIRKND